MSDPIFINKTQVKDILTWPMTINAVEEACKAVAEKEFNPAFPDTSFACQPPRSFTFSKNKSGVLLTMPGFVGNHKMETSEENTTVDTLCCKVVTSFRGNEKRQPPIPNILANILLFNTETGKLDCIMDGTQITAWRTAASSIVATKYLYFMRWPDVHRKSIVLAIIGCGTQGRSHAFGMCSTFNVSEIFLWNRTKSKADDLALNLKSNKAAFLNPETEIKVTDCVADCVAKADVIFIGTYSPEALLFRNMIKNDSVHINAVGAGEIHYGEVSQDIYDVSKTYVDYLESAKIELKTLKAVVVGEVGEVIRKKQYPKCNEITIFQSMGMAALDATVARAVYETFKLV